MPKKYRQVIVVGCTILFAIVLLVAIVPVRNVVTDTRNYQIIAVHYNHVVGWNTVPGDRDQYQVTWVADDGKIVTEPFLVTASSIHLADSNFVRIEFYFSESLFGLRMDGHNTDLYLTSETLDSSWRS